MKIIFQSFFCLFLFISIQGISQDNLDPYLIEAAENNPELKAYFNEYMSAMEKVPQVGALPDPQLSFGAFVRPMEFAMGRQRAEISLMQMFPWFGMLKTQKNEASQMALMKYNAFQEAKNKLFFKVKSTWFSLYALEEEINILKKNIEIMKSIERIALIRYQQGGSASGSPSGKNMDKQSNGQSSGAKKGESMKGMGSSNLAKASNNMKGSGMSSGEMGSKGTGMVDVLRIQMEIAEMENEMEALLDAQKPLNKKFNQLLNRPLGQQINAPENLSAQEITPEQLARLDIMILKNPMLNMLKNEKQAFQLQEKMSRLEGRPMIGAGVNYMVFSPINEGATSMGGNNMIMPMVTLTLPIYRKKYKAMEKEAQHLQQSSEHKWEDTANKIVVELEEAKKAHKDASRKIKLYQQQSELAEHALNIVTTAYANGQTDFEEVLRVQQQLLDYQLKYINALVAQNTAVAILEMLAASEL